MTDLEIRKIMIDSRHRSTGSSTDFTFDLPESVYLPEGTRAYVTDCIIPCAWYTVEKDVNDRVYSIIPAFGGTPDNVLVTIPPGSYSGTTLAAAMATQLTNAINSSGKTVAGSYSAETNKISLVLSTGEDFRLVPDSELKAMTSIQFFNPVDQNMTPGTPVNPISINEVLNLTESTLGATQTFFPDIRRIHQVLICSSSFGNAKTLGPTGQQTCIKRVPIAALFGGIALYDSYHSHDFIECGNATLSRIHITLTDISGRVLNLHGANIAFSIIFN